MREADENDVCYQCDKKGHFEKNCPRNMLTRYPKINYVKNAKFAKKNQGKYQKYPRKVHRDKMNAIIESQTDQIASLTKQMSDLMAVLASKPSGAEANTTKINSVDFPEDILDINKEAETDIFHFL